MNTSDNQTKLVRKKELLKKVTKYVICGGFATVVDYVVFFTALNLLNMHYLIANTLSFMFGLTTNYFISREWVFNWKTHDLKRDFTLYTVTSIIGLIINNSIMFVLIGLGILEFLINLALNYDNDSIIKLFAKMMATAVVLIWNYFSKSKIVFRER